MSAIRSSSIRKMVAPGLLGAIGLALAGLTAWRGVAILESSSMPLMLGLGLVAFGFWLILGLILGQTFFSLTPAQRIALLLAGLLGGLLGTLLTPPAGFSKLTLTLTASDVWSPTIFEAVWTADNVGTVPIRLPLEPSEPVILEIEATGRHDPAAADSQIWLVEAFWPDGSTIPWADFQAGSGWRRHKIDWESYQGKRLWISDRAQPAVLRWQGAASGPLTLLFAAHPLGGRLRLRWNEDESQTVDLYSPHPVPVLKAVTLPLNKPAIWQARLPLTALGQEIGVTTRLDPTSRLNANFQQIRLAGLPGSGLVVSGHQLARALHIEKGWPELTATGLYINPSLPFTAPQLFLTGPFESGAIWGWLLPWLEGGLIGLYLAGGGVLLGLWLLRLLPARLLPDLNLATAALLVSLLLVEIALGVIWPAGHLYAVWKPNMRLILQPDPEAMPGVSGQTQVVINSQGLRADPPASPADYQILTLGGSTTESLYLDQGEAWPYRLQQRLNQAGDRQVWIGNAGRSGRNTREHVLQARYLLPQHPQLDALILLTGINDLGLRLERGERYQSDYLTVPGSRNALMRRAFDVFPLQDSDTLPRYRQTWLWRLLDRLWQEEFQTRAIAAAQANEILVTNQEGDGSFILNRRAMRQLAPQRQQLPDLSTALTEYGRNLNAIIDLAQGRGVRVILLTQPTLWRPDLSPAEEALLWFGWGPDYEYFYGLEALIEGIRAYNQTLLEVCQQRQVECIDLANLLPQDGSVFYDDVHFNEPGAEQVSQILAEYLLTRPPLAADD